MKQKYIISKSVEKNVLIIKEFAELEKNKDYSLTYEGTYDGKAIISAISKGKEALILTLRNASFYPPSFYAEKIDETVLKLYGSQNDQFMEIFLMTRISFQKI